MRVTGTVRYGGTPVEDASVLFEPVEDSGQTLSSQSVTDSNGQFELSTYVGGGRFEPGIVPGKYGVAITKLDAASTPTMRAPPKNVLPKKYATPKTSGLSVEVAADKENDFPLTITN